MSLRDDLLPVFDDLRQLPPYFGLRRYAVVLRRRIWSGQYINDGTVTVQDITLTPIPRVRNSFSSKGMSPQALEFIMTNGAVIMDRLYTIDKITPPYTKNGVSGGYSSEHLRMRPSPDVANVEPVVLLVGDDGYLRECTQLTLEQDRAFGYRMLVQESNRPRVALSSISVTSADPLAIDSVPLQLIATATFEDPSTSVVTPLAIWTSSDEAVAAVDTLGRVTAAGTSGQTATITATLAGATASVLVTVA